MPSAPAVRAARSKAKYKLVSRLDGERMRHIHDRLRKGGRLTLGRLCDAVNAEMRDERTPCSAKTIQRTVKAMRENFPEHFPLTYDKHDKTWRYEPASAASFPAHELDLDFEKEWLFDNERSLAIVLARRALAQFKGTPLHKGIEAFFDRLVDEIGAGSKERVRRMVRRVAFPVAQPVMPVPDDLWAALHECMDGNFALRMTYRSGRSGETARRTVHPLGLLVYGGSWFLLAKEPALKNGRPFEIFQVARMSELEPLAEEFALPPDFSLDVLVADAVFGYPDCGPKEKVRLRFTKEATGGGREMTRWHPSEKRSFDAQGRMVLEFETSSRFAVVREIVSWGGGIEVLAPKSLREEVRRKGEALAGING